jgi:acyl-coenzyme A thioesterase PaaI-like protein
MNPLPPYAQLLKLRTEAEESGAPLFIMPFHDDVIGRPGFLHGGAIAGLLEFAAFATLRRALGEGKVEMKPINVTVDYMRGGHPRDTFASATIERLGARIANVEAQAWQKDRKAPIAAAQMNFLLVREPQ